MYTLSLKKVADEGTHHVQDLALSLQDLGLGEPWVAPGAVVSFDLHRTFGKVYTKIRAQAHANLVCGHCLKEYQAVLRVDFSMLFEEKSSYQPEPDDVDLDESEAVSVFDGDELPLGEEIRQELELQLPFAPLCKRDCQGLCPRCGHDLNLGDCDCPKAPQGGAFADLDQLFKKKAP